MGEEGLALQAERWWHHRTYSHFTDITAELTALSTGVEPGLEAWGVWSRPQVFARHCPGRSPIGRPPATPVSPAMLQKWLPPQRRSWGRPVHPRCGMSWNEAEPPFWKVTSPWASFLLAQEGAGRCLALAGT